MFSFLVKDLQREVCLSLQYKKVLRESSCGRDSPTSTTDTFQKEISHSFCSKGRLNLQLRRPSHLQLDGHLVLHN
ncbi:unnamed protein product [Lasius platythorax]|uniref:Uncharacterized protein n=1 Tax=Lasius platythorax TaxID=488582 RepID=A0AAV2N060_9HYME